jgi:hypothetical protein
MVYGLWFMVYGSRFTVQGLGFRVYGECGAGNSRAKRSGRSTLVALQHALPLAAEDV